METVSYKCPCCGSALAYSGGSQTLKCGSCGNEFELNALSQFDEIEKSHEQDRESEWTFGGDAYSDSEKSEMRVYSCPFCGAELMTDENTTATVCAYCGNNAVLSDRLTDEKRPQYLIPFEVAKEQAEQMFRDYFSKKWLLPNIFLKDKNKIHEIRGLYAPFWLFDCDAEADITFNAEQRTVRRSGNYEVTTTRHYLARRAGALSFDFVPVDGAERLDDRLTESIEPYDYSKLQPFQMPKLSGALADRHDKDANTCRKRANERITNSTVSAFRNTVVGYTSVTTRHANVWTDNGRATSVLLPVWLITTVKKDKVYTFAINGQTGKLVCNLPCSKLKAFAAFLGVGVAATAVVGALLGLL